MVTQPNEKRCLYTKQQHKLSLPACCPVSKNPAAGSYILISYIPDLYHLEVYALRKYIDSYIGGKGEIRSMEGMIQEIARYCCQALKVTVKVKAVLNLEPNQQMVLKCKMPYS